MDINIIYKEEFEHLSKNRSTGFNRSFLWPVVIKSLSKDVKIEKMEDPSLSLEKLSFKETSLAYEESVKTFGKDIMLKNIVGNYYVAFGFFNMTSGRDYTKSEKLLRMFGIRPIYIASSSLYSFGIGLKGKLDYKLREYRAGAQKFQSYFKDDHFSKSERKIEERLENDWNDGIKPYQIVLHRNSNDAVSIYGNGLILFNKFEGGLKLANYMSTIAIGERKHLDNKVKDVSFSVLPNLPIRIVEKSPLFIDVNIKGEEKRKLAEQIIKSLSSSFVSYGGAFEESTCHFILQRESNIEGSVRILSSFALNIFNDKVIVSPISESDNADLVDIFYGIERLVKVKEKWLDS